MDAHTANRETTCPSAPADEGAVFFGVIVRTGEVAYISPNVPVTSALLDAFHTSGIQAENRLRFASRCMEQSCVHWSVDRCGLIDRAVPLLGKPDLTEALPNCGIRGTCRWFSQHGRKACAACPEVVRMPASAQ
jgi:hypothetical protein